MKKSLFFIAVIMFFQSKILISQKWVEMMSDPNANFYETQKEFYAYWKNRKVEKEHGYKQFKRWEYRLA